MKLRNGKYLMINLAAPCGLYCGECEDLGGICQGCTSTDGKPYWTTKIDVAVCPLYECCINKQQLEHCGLCRELPFQLFQSFHDPVPSAEEAEQAVIVRKNDLLRRKAVGTVKWLGEKTGEKGKS